jgi:hypothetical protein
LSLSFFHPLLSALWRKISSLPLPFKNPKSTILNRQSLPSSSAPSAPWRFNNLPLPFKNPKSTIVNRQSIFSPLRALAGVSVPLRGQCFGRSVSAARKQRCVATEPFSLLPKHRNTEIQSPLFLRALCAILARQSLSGDGWRFNNLLFHSKIKIHQSSLVNQSPSYPPPLMSSPSPVPEVLVRVEIVSKIFCRDLKKSLWYGLQDSAKDLLTWGTRTPVPGASCLVPGEESRAVPGASCLVPCEESLEGPQGHDRLHKAPSTKHQAPSTKHQAPSTKHQAPSTKHKAQSTAAQPPTKHKAQSTKHNERGLRPSEFLAVDNVSFELKRGECLGLIDHNGAGRRGLL